MQYTNFKGEKKNGGRRGRDLYKFVTFVIFKNAKIILMLL